MRTFVAEHRTVDSFLGRSGALIEAVVDERSPPEQGVASTGAQDELLAGAEEVAPGSASCRGNCTVVPLIQIQAGQVPVGGQPPKRGLRSISIHHSAKATPNFAALICPQSCTLQNPPIHRNTALSIGVDTALEASMRSRHGMRM